MQKFMLRLLVAETSDGHDMVAPSGEGGERAMKLAYGT